MFIILIKQIVHQRKSKEYFYFLSVTCVEMVCSGFPLAMEFQYCYLQYIFVDKVREYPGIFVILYHVVVPKM